MKEMTIEHLAWIKLRAKVDHSNIFFGNSRDADFFIKAVEDSFKEAKEKLNGKRY